MMFDSSKIRFIEERLRNLVSGAKGVRKIRGCSSNELEIYRISFGYQRKKPLKSYLLIYDSDERTITLCADGGTGLPPNNVRERLMKNLDGKNYREEPDAYSWVNVYF